MLHLTFAHVCHLHEQERFSGPSEKSGRPLVPGNQSIATKASDRQLPDATQSHMRTNQYEALITLARIKGRWKINDLAILEEERVTALHLFYHLVGKYRPFGRDDGCTNRDSDAGDPALCRAGI